MNLLPAIGITWFGSLVASSDHLDSPVLFVIFLKLSVIWWFDHILNHILIKFDSTIKCDKMWSGFSCQEWMPQGKQLKRIDTERFADMFDFPMAGNSFKLGDVMFSAKVYIYTHFLGSSGWFSPLFSLIVCLSLTSLFYFPPLSLLHLLL